MRPASINDVPWRKQGRETSELRPKIRAAAGEIEAERELPRALFEALADAGFYHMAVPRSLGGAELDLPTYIQVLEELGKADASTAWACNQGALYPSYAAPRR